MKNLILKYIIIVAVIVALIELFFTDRAITSFKNRSESIVKKRTLLNNNDKKIDKAIKIYGYSDILDILKNYEKLNIKNFEKQPGDRATVKVTLEYFGEIEEVKKYLNEISKEGVFNKIDQFAITYGEKKSISIDLEFKYGLYNISYRVP